MPDIKAILEKLDSGDQTEVYKANLALFQYVHELGGSGKEEARAELAEKLATALTATKEQDENQRRRNAPPSHVHTVDTRNRLCRALSLLGGEAATDALAHCLKHFDCREMARWALDRLSGSASTELLIKAATEGIGEEFRVGAINALAHRRGGDVVTALRECSSDQHLEVRLAAAEALANQPDASLDVVILSAWGNGDTRAQKRIAKARIRLASTLADAGDTRAARKIYTSVLNGETDLAQKHAAELALAELA